MKLTETQMSDTQLIRMSPNGSARIARELVAACVKNYVPQDVAEASRKAAGRFSRQLMLDIEKELQHQTMKAVS